MSPHRDEHLDLCAGYALGCLDERDRAQLDRHLSEGCELCERALREFSIGATLLAGSLPAGTPGPALRDRVLIAAGSLRPGGPGAEPRADERSPGAGKVIPIQRRRTVSVWPALGWAVAAAFAITTVVFWSRIESMRSDLFRAQEEQRWSALLNAPGARVALLGRTPRGPAALHGRAVMDPTTRRAVLVLEGARVPAGRDYELWAIRGSGAHALGLVRPDARGHAVLRIEDVGDPATIGAFAVSLEPRGGAPTADAPTGPVILLGKIEG